MEKAASSSRFSAVLSTAKRLSEAIDQAVVGRSEAVELMLAAVLCEGHVLIEDVPGTGKTLLAKSLASALGAGFRRIQFTPDLLPADITGSNVFNQRTGDFEFRRGPLFSHVVLADEINRATPRTQSALLEAMEEGQVTIDGQTMRLERPFLVLATQNPVDLEGTFPLPEAQLDRFLFQMKLGYPSAEDESAILLRNGAADIAAAIKPCVSLDDIRDMHELAAKVYVAPEVRDYIVTLVRATRERSDVALGASPRAGIALFRAARALACLRGRSYVMPDDIKYLAVSVLSHRLILTSEARLKGVSGPDVVAQILERVPVPVERDIEQTATHA